jgi:hypothetical protein
VHSCCHRSAWSAPHACDRSRTSRSVLNLRTCRRQEHVSRPAAAAAAATITARGHMRWGGGEAGIRLGAAELWQTCREKQRQPRLKKQNCVYAYVIMCVCNSRSIEPFPHVYGKAQILLGHPRQRGGGPFPTPSGQVLEHLLSSISPGGVAQALHRGRAAGSDLHSHGTGPEHQRPKNSPNGFPFFFEDLPWRSSKGRVMSTFPGFVYTYI